MGGFALAALPRLPPPTSGLFVFPFWGDLPIHRNSKVYFLGRPRLAAVSLFLVVFFRETPAPHADGRGFPSQPGLRPLTSL